MKYTKCTLMLYPVNSKLVVTRANGPLVSRERDENGVKRKKTLVTGLEEDS